jgi:hypothetical protein
VWIFRIINDPSRDGRSYLNGQAEITGPPPQSPQRRDEIVRPESCTRCEGHRRAIKFSGSMGVDSDFGWMVGVFHVECFDNFNLRIYP